MVNTEKITRIHEKNGTNQTFTNTHGKSEKNRKTYFFPFFPVGGTSVYPVDKQQPRTGRTKLILAVSAFILFFPFIVSFVSFQLRFPFRSLPPSFRFPSSFPCVTSVLSFHVLYSVRYFFPFVSTLRVVSTLRFRSLRLSFRFTLSLLCVTSVRSFQVLCPVRFFFPFVSALPCRLLRPSF